jgi:hypothetical protein
MIQSALIRRKYLDTNGRIKAVLPGNTGKTCDRNEKGPALKLALLMLSVVRFRLPLHRFHPFP